jgi:hypothetical protein
MLVAAETGVYTAVDKGIGIVEEVGAVERTTAVAVGMRMCEV